MSTQESGRQGPDPEHGSYRFTNCFPVERGVTPVDVMEVMQEDPQAVFPFPIDAEGPDSIEIGREFSLRPVFLDSENVIVNERTNTSFGFIAEEDHLRGEGANLRFQTFQQTEGIVCLEQSATFKRNVFTPLLDFGSRIMWKIQSMRLEHRLREESQKTENE